MQDVPERVWRSHAASGRCTELSSCSTWRTRRTCCSNDANCRGVSLGLSTVESRSAPCGNSFSRRRQTLGELLLEREFCHALRCERRACGTYPDRHRTPQPPLVQAQGNGRLHGVEFDVT